VLTGLPARGARERVRGGARFPSAAAEQPGDCRQVVEEVGRWFGRKSMTHLRESISVPA